jgi:hypothetical protein
MRESPLPGFAGGAGLLVGRVVVAIAKCMLRTGLSPEESEAGRSGLGLRGSGQSSMLGRGDASFELSVDQFELASGYQWSGGALTENH